jgi:elongation factor Ts
MQIAAMNPLQLTRDGVDASVIDKELEIAKEQLINEGKPAEIAEKAARVNCAGSMKSAFCLNRSL